jgi:hypothetical protein
VPPYCNFRSAERRQDRAEQPALRGPNTIEKTEALAPYSAICASSRP